ncbi:ATP-binding protein [Oscillatoria sp. FACHB-1406]|uniref:sensor histidine kinase n=1 Tax=Oscillatoria sp. FACHB-1406 TaxID=2692846 RepID=UPI001682729A|nr:ATP-binding protein [Oscillatoria sp. FACHB-1406]MBD2579733.1 sensor histidine kinase [Oscillatoria sp. FACHB-1406]
MQSNLSSESLFSPFPIEGLHDLTVNSTLLELPLCDLQIESTCLGSDLVELLQRWPLLPGAILTENGRFVGPISRRKLMEYLFLPRGLELFLPRPLQVLYAYICPELLIFPSNTTILETSKRVLKRASLLLLDPIVVQINSSTYRLLDFAHLNLAAWQIRGIETQVRYERTQVQTLQSEKMASLGRLVDGMAHEILDPVGFIWGNLAHVSQYSNNLLELIAAYDACYEETPESIERLKEELDLDFLLEDFPRVVASITSGAKRLKTLVASLQNFCHVDEVYPKPADIHACLDGLVVLLKNRLRSEILLVKDYDRLPPVTCYIGQLSQVFMNILTNAIDVLLEDAVSEDFEARPARTVKPTITVTTQVKSRPVPDSEFPERWVSIAISDNGPGMSEAMQEAIRESFTVEKRAAKETSLSVSYQIVTAKHGGEFYLRSHLGEGTEFEILLPLL